MQVEVHMEQHEDEDEDKIKKVHEEPMADYVSEFCQLAGVIQDWPEPVKIHFFKERLHPEVAQWVTVEPTSLAVWYMRAGEAEILLCRVQLLKQRSSPLREAPPPTPCCSPLGGVASGHRNKGAAESLYACHCRLGLCLHCRGERHLAAVCPSK
uniref:Uncharacterized protein n=1 Tax=Sphaerodactylus townsendi TaxID=933632 RepID=A0ACB8FS81_9SAUR